MYLIKQSPEDFIVKERTNRKLKDKGTYSIVKLTKRDYTTLKAIETIAQELNLRTKDIGFAGNKDRKAITEQYISLKTNPARINKLCLKDITLELMGFSDEPLSLGDLEGNDFVITIRNIKEIQIKNIEKAVKTKLLIPNLFGQQRFSKNNIAIGKAIVKKDYKKAVALLLSSEGEIERRVKESLEGNNYIGALQTVNKKILKLYIHAYQSWLWNEAVKQYKNKKNIKIPIIGFGTEIKDEISKQIMKKENVTPRDFIIRAMPELSAEGELRDLYIELKDLKIKEKNKEDIKITFSLKKGQYATTVIDFLCKNL